MSQGSNHNHDRWEELQVTRLLFGLTPAEQTEYEDLARQMPPSSREQFDSVVAALDVAWAEPASEPLPEHLRRTVQRQAELELTSRSTHLPETAGKSHAPGRSAPPSLVARYVPWGVAAACLLFAVFTLVRNRGTEPVSRTSAELRAELLAANEGLVKANWAAGPTPLGNAAGDVVWSSPRQRGYMLFRGLPINDPTKEQYQLWIFDKNQSDQTPIDGGVFDITNMDEAIVPINAKLAVREPFMFAVTIEKPGGVVVSSRERLPLLAKLE